MEPPLLLSRKEMLRLLDISLSKYKQLLKKGARLPEPVMMEDRECWKRSEVMAFVESLPRARPKVTEKQGDKT